MLYDRALTTSCQPYMLARALNIVFPPQCLSCDALVPNHGTLCLECWQQVEFITDPCCACCGYPFEFTMGPGTLCGDCLREQPVYARARAAFRYNEASRRLVLKLKFQDQTLLAKIFAGWLASAGRELIAASDVIVPVPLHYWRFIGRRYNQSVLLAQALSPLCGLPTIPDALKRIRYTPPQAGLTRAQRLDNVKGVFSVNARHIPAIKGNSVLLIDDVMTTGATLQQCTKALIKAGASQVNVLTLSRTVSG